MLSSFQMFTKPMLDLYMCMLCLLLVSCVYFVAKTPQRLCSLTHRSPPCKKGNSDLGGALKTSTYSRCNKPFLIRQKGEKESKREAQNLHQITYEQVKHG